MKKLLLIPAFMAMFFAGSVAVPAAFAAQPAPPQENKMMLPPPKDGKRPQRLRKNCSQHMVTVILICCDC